MEFDIIPPTSLDLSSDKNLQSLITNLKETLKPLIMKRAVNKRQITNISKRIDSMVSEDNYETDLVDSLCGEINVLISKIKDIDDLVTDVYTDHEIMSYDPTLFEREIDDRSIYHMDINARLVKFKRMITDISNYKAGSSNTTVIKQEALPPALSCNLFYGDRDKNDFKTFLSQFENIVGSKESLSDSSKLQYLKSFLRGSAYRLICHLGNVNENYSTALNLLNGEYLDESKIVHDMLNTITNAPCFNNSDLDKLRSWLNEVRAMMLELCNFNVDFFVEDSPGNILLSLILVKKLPPIFLKELISKIDNSYPKLNDIFENYNRILTNLSVVKQCQKRDIDTNPVKSRVYTNAGARPKMANFKTIIAKPNERVDLNSNNKLHPITKRPFKINKNSAATTSSALSNVVNKKQNDVFSCKFCSVDGHSMVTCPNYKSFDQRIMRCKDLGLCTHCSSAKHDDLQCPGYRYGLSFNCFFVQSFFSYISLMSWRFKGDFTS